MPPPGPLAHPGFAEGAKRLAGFGLVLDVWGEPIPHLYCSGCDTGSNIFGVPGNYPGCGCYVSFSFAFGRIAGKHMADSEAVA